MHEVAADVAWADSERLTLSESTPDPEVERDPVPVGQRLPYRVNTILLPGPS